MADSTVPEIVPMKGTNLVIHHIRRNGERRAKLEEIRISKRGEMAERSMAVVLKTTVPERVPGVRIPLSPPITLLR